MTAPSSPSELGAAPAGPAKTAQATSESAMADVRNGLIVSPVSFRGLSTISGSAPGAQPSTLVRVRAPAPRAQEPLDERHRWPSCAVSGPREADGRTRASSTREARARSRPRSGEQCRRRRCGSPATSSPPGRGRSRRSAGPAEEASPELDPERRRSIGEGNGLVRRGPRSTGPGTAGRPRILEPLQLVRALLRPWERHAFSAMRCARRLERVERVRVDRALVSAA